MATIKEIADRLGVSISTVSKGLNGASDISEEMRQTVLDTAMEMGYIHRRKKNAALRRLCVMVENMAYESIHGFGYEVIAGFRLAAVKQNCEVSVIAVDDFFQQKQSCGSLMRQHGYDGAFLLGFDLNDTYLKQIEEISIPTVLLDNYLPGHPMTCYVGTDNSESMQLVVDYLTSLGHRRIAYLGGFDDSFVEIRRREAFERFMRCHGLKADPLLCGSGLNEPETAKKYLPGFIERGATAVICTSDLIASGSISELYRMGMRVPEDMSVVGFDDLPIARYLAPPLTTVHQDRQALGRCALAMLEQMISGCGVGVMLLHPELKIRDSCKAVKPSESPDGYLR